MKKIISIFIVFVYIFNLFSAKNIYADNVLTNTDIEKLKNNIADFEYIEPWAQEALLIFFNEGILELDLQNNFNPKKSITRLQTLKLIMKALKTPLETLDKSQTIFTDVDVESPDYIYIYTAFKKGFVKGVDNKFLPNNPITRAEFLKILYKVSDVNTNVEKAENPFKDIKNTDWYYNIVIKAYNDQIVKGFNDGEFKPNQSITNSQAIKIAYYFRKFYASDINYIKSKADNLNYEMLNFYLINIARQEYNKKPNLIYDEDLAKIAKVQADFLLNNDLKPDYCGDKIYIKADNEKTDEDKNCHKNNMSSPRDRLLYHNIQFEDSAENIAFIKVENKSIAESIISIHNAMMQGKDDEVNHKTKMLGIFVDYKKVGIAISYKKENNILKLFLVQTFVK